MYHELELAVKTGFIRVQAASTASLAAERRCPVVAPPNRSALAPPPLASASACLTPGALAGRMPSVDLERGPTRLESHCRDKTRSASRSIQLIRSSLLIVRTFF